MKKTCLAVRMLIVMSCFFVPTERLNAGDDSDPNLRRAVIKPSLVRLNSGQQQQFKIILTPGVREPASIPQKVNWFVNKVPGGNEILGTIDANGLYRAPKKTPSPPEIHICAEVIEAKNRYQFATVLMAKPVYKLVKSWTEPEGTSPVIRDPHGIAVAPDGTVIIADRDISKVSRCTTAGKFLHYIGKGQGEGPAQFADPRIADIGPGGNIWISDCKKKWPLPPGLYATGNFYPGVRTNRPWAGPIASRTRNGLWPTRAAVRCGCRQLLRKPLQHCGRIPL